MTFLPAEAVARALEQRLDPVHARLRLGMEREHEAHAARRGLKHGYIRGQSIFRLIVEAALSLSGTRRRGQANAAAIAVRAHDVTSARLPAAFDGFTILHLTDPHADLSIPAMTEVARLIGGLQYDLCVLTGDYRNRTYGPYQPCLEAMLPVLTAIQGQTLGILGNHDPVLLVPDLERLGVRMLLNENVAIERGGARLYVAGIDDPHLYRLDNIEKAAGGIPDDAFSILLSHSPEVYRKAAHAGFDLMLAGHTHGGQICLPGGVPAILAAVMPRRMANGSWRHEAMAGYTSAGAGTCQVAARFNCPPEITLHRLRRM